MVFGQHQRLFADRQVYSSVTVTIIWVRMPVVQTVQVEGAISPGLQNLAVGTLHLTYGAAAPAGWLHAHIGVPENHRGAAPASIRTCA